MRSAARRITLNVPMRLTWITRANCSSGMTPPLPITRPGVPMPAQLTAIRNVPARGRDVQRRRDLGLVRDIGRREDGGVTEFGRGCVARRRSAGRR